MESCKILIKLSLNLHKFYTVLPCQCFFLGILLCSQSGDHREEDAEKQAIILRKILAKSRYKPACSVQNCTNFQRVYFQPLWKFCCPPLCLLASWRVSQITEGPEQNRPFSCNFQPPFYVTVFLPQYFHSISSCLNRLNIQCYKIFIFSCEIYESRWNLFWVTMNVAGCDCKCWFFSHLISSTTSLLACKWHDYYFKELSW